MRALLLGILSLAIVLVTTVEGAEVRELIARLKEKDNETRRAAAKELGEMGSQAKAAVPELVKAMRDKDLFVRRYAAEALGKIGPDARAGVPALSAALSDERKEVQLAAVEALGQMGTVSIDALINTVKDPNKDPTIRRLAAQGLGKIGPQARGAVTPLSDILTGKIASPKGARGKGGEDDIKPEVARALGLVAKVEDKVAIEALKLVSEGKQQNRELQKAAALALRKLTGPQKKKP